MLYKRLLNPKVLVNEANAGHVLAPPAVETDFGPRRATGAGARDALMTNPMQATDLRRLGSEGWR
jgi:hypothetical protein